MKWAGDGGFFVPRIPLSLEEKFYSMKKILVLLFLSASISSFAQKKNIVFKVKEGNNRVTFYASNKTIFDRSVTLYFNSIKGLYGYSEPVTKVVPAGKRIEFLVLRFNGKYSYNYSYRSKSVATESQEVSWEEKIRPFEFKKNDKVSKGIVVFSKDGCSACRRTMDFFIKNKIDFNFINISKSDENRSLMWKLIREKNKKITRVPTPVVLVEGRLHHSFKDLNKFLKKLNKKYGK